MSMNHVRTRSPKLLFCFTVCVTTAVSLRGLAGAAEPERLAEAILRETGVKGGLCVALGDDCADLAVEMSRRGPFLVHCLCTNGDALADAREAIRASGSYGRVSANCASLPALPYVDNLVNLVVVSEDEGQVSRTELMRVLAPGGVALISEVRDQKSEISRGAERLRVPTPTAGAANSDGGKWARLVKRWPREIDEWTHWLHGADGNAVAKDTVVGPPRHVQWVDGPIWLRHHNTVPSIGAMVSSRGRLFYICDEATPGIRGLPDKWSLIARDAFNGVLLWKRPIPNWSWKEWSDREISRFNQPIHLPRRLVAVGDRVYVTLGFNAPVVALDAATGKTVMTYRGTELTSEILCHEGMLILSVNQAAQKPGRVKKLPPVKKRIVVLEADTGKRLWAKGDFLGIRSKADAMERITHLTLAVAGDRIFFLEEDAVVSLNLKTGQELWRAPRPTREEKVASFAYHLSNLCTLVAHDGAVLLAQPDAWKGHIPWNQSIPGDLLALSAETGKTRWTHRCGNWGYGSPPDVFVINGLVWVHDGKPFSMVGLDLGTGQERSKFSTAKALDSAHHHRCYRNKATSRYVLTARRGIELIDLTTQQCRVHHWVRGACRFGIVPCNGLLYVPPHPCVCYITAKLNGLYVPGAGGSEERGARSEGRLRRGPAYGSASQQTASRGEQPDDWVTYRHDGMRSGSTTSAVPAKLHRLWQAEIGGKLTSPTVAGGKVLVAAVDSHCVHALDAGDGKPVWRCTVGGRVDTPPTIHNGLAIFGSADGWVYCLRASDGQLVWRFRAAPMDRRLVSFGRLESVWPVHGSVLVRDDVAYFCAGRSSFLDGGIYIYALDTKTGKLLQQRRIYDPDPETGEMAERRLRYDMPPEQLGALPDLLASDGDSIYLRHVKLDPRDISRPVETRRPMAVVRKRRKEPVPGPQVVSAGGFLDDTWFNQVYWTFRGQSHCKLLVCDAKTTYGVKPFRGRNRHSRALFVPGKKGYTLFADDHASGERRWAVHVPIRVKAMVLAGTTLFVAGAADVVDAEDPWAAFEGRKGARLWAISTADGKKLAEHRLEALPTFDGMAAAGSRLYVSTKTGKVLCLGGRP